MAKNYYCYPRLGFVPQTRTLSDGTLVAHAGDTPFWCAQDMRVYRQDDAGVFARQKVYEWDTKKYAQIGPSGHPIGHTYPGFNYRGTNYDVHRLMAMAWIGAIPEGWQVDHKNGDIYNWSLDNIRIVTVAENYRCGVILRWLRGKGVNTKALTGMQAMVAFVIVPVLEPKRRAAIQAEELLTLMSSYNVAGDCYEGE